MIASDVCRLGLFLVAFLLTSAGAVKELCAEVPVQRTVDKIPSSNGYGAIMLDLSSRRLTHFREHIFAAEEPRIDGSGNELFVDGKPLDIPTRDLLYDAYFGLRVDGKQSWLTGDEVLLDDSGYAPFASGKQGGSGIVRLVQKRGNLLLEQSFFAPMNLEHAGFVMVLKLSNQGSTVATGVSAFSLHNFHMGFGRPGVRQDIAENGETVVEREGDLEERGFAGVVLARALGTPSHVAGSSVQASANSNLFAVVDSGSGDYPDLKGAAATSDGSVSGYQWDVGDLAPGQSAYVGVVFAHHGDPFAVADVTAWLDSYVDGDAAAMLNKEIAYWQSFQQGIKVPATLSGDDETLFRHSATTLAMAQVREKSAFLREFLSKDGEPRRTRFGTSLGGPAATLPATVAHRAHGAILASLPPGEWTVSWIRDGAYAVAAMAGAGMHQQARDALSFYLRAEAGRFQNYNELASYNMPPYQISLVRYYGFGVEETDFNAYGPNLEFDGFGLFLWALQRYVAASGDTAFVEENWDKIAGKVADAIVGLVRADTGLLLPDSSIWETHWNGRERSWAYTNITAARGLCDMASMARALGKDAAAEKYRTAGQALRAAIARNLLDKNGAVASNAEELARGQGYWDAAVVDAVAMQLFDPKGRIASATLAGLDANLSTPAGAGWARNDDRFDHPGQEDLSPWGSEYDSGEWVIVDLRGAVANWLAGDVARADRLSNWVRDQALANFLEVAEVFDEGKGTYKFNSPMAGFGAGAFMLARMIREESPSPACGAYFVETDAPGSGGAGGAVQGPPEPPAASGCSCRVVASHNGAPGWSLLALGLALAYTRRRWT